THVSTDVVSVACSSSEKNVFDNNAPQPTLYNRKLSGIARIQYDWHHDGRAVPYFMWETPSSMNGTAIFQSKRLGINGLQLSIVTFHNAVLISEGQKYQTFLTSCNAISSSGQIIHLVDENGCIVDSELIGEVVYNSFMPKVFARARVFKFMNDEKYVKKVHSCV
ncbi:hypothetical protein COOONC_26602, partial [Cooperia oncophora]